MESGKNQLSLLQKYQWVGDANKDVKKVLNINSSPDVDEAFKLLLYSIASRCDEAFLKEQDNSTIEVFVCPMEIAHTAKNMPDISKSHSEKIQSLSDFCDLTELFLIRFTVENCSFSS